MSTTGIVGPDLPENVRTVPAAPTIRWQAQFIDRTYDGYVFEDDTSDLAKFFRWMAAIAQERRWNGPVQFHLWDERPR